MTEAQIPDRPATPEGWTERGKGFLPGLVGLVVTEIAPGRASGHLDVRPEHLAPNGFLHAATVITVADTLAGYGCTMSLPEGATGFTTIELKSNFLGTARDGRIRGEVTMAHGGRTTQVWDGRVTDDTGQRVIALFRCTQMVLYPR